MFAGRQKVGANETTIHTVSMPARLLLLFLAFSACRDPQQPFSKTIAIQDAHFQGTVILEKVESIGQYRIRIENTTNGERDRIFTPYEVFAMETGDVNGDGTTDICIGIIKPTPFDPSFKKRLFLFQIDRNYIRPLWLSSRLVRPLETFVLLKSETGGDKIRTVEKQDVNHYCVNEYQWASFGMSFVRECRSGLSYPEARSYLTTAH